MTTEEVLERIEHIKNVHYFYEIKLTLEDCDALNRAMCAAKKTIPQKVTHEATLYKCCTCPYCKNVVDEFTEFSGNKVRVRVEHCKFCGQALDWSDNNE